MLVQTVLVLSRLTFVMAVVLGWDSDTTRSNIPMSMYLDCICYRFQSQSSTSASSSQSRKQNPDILFVFKMMLESVKTSYERRVSNIVPTVEAPIDKIARGYCPIQDPTLNEYFNIADSTYGNSMDLSGSGTSTSTTAPAMLYFDIWSTMTGSWAEQRETSLC